MFNLNGYKSYISGGLIVLFAILFALGVIDKETFGILFGLFTGTGIISLKHSNNKLVAKMNREFTKSS